MTRLQAELNKLISGKRILILGFGREGRATLSMLEQIGTASEIAIGDAKSFEESEINHHTGRFGDNYLDCIDEYDITFKSPGIVLPKPASEYKSIITSETECFIHAYKDRVIGITGTKGKSTTASLLYHVLKESGIDALFAGNIGIPVFNIDNEVTDESVIVIELSCHQLEFAMTSPHRSVLLNIYEDHLDHYGTREKYALAKKNIYKHQTSSDILYTTREALEGDKPLSITKCPDASDLPFASFEEIGSSLVGGHNLLNASFVYEIYKEFNLSDEEFTKAVASFEPLPHRLQFVGNFDGIDYYDDSISTTVKSTINAVLSIKNAGVLLIGGMERNIEYDELVDFIKDSSLDFAVCMYESGKRVFDMLSNENKVNPGIVYADDLEKAVLWVKENAYKNRACILSPAAASYGYFKNFEERGDFFAKIVAKR